MSDNTQNLPVQNERDQNLLDFTADELLQELEKAFGPAVADRYRRPNDLDMDQLRKHFGLSRESIRMRMAPLLKSGEWHVVRAMNPDGSKVNVYRKGK